MVLISTLTRALHRWTTPDSTSEPTYHTPRALRAALERERARSDRTGTVFSFLSFTRCADRAGLERVVQALRSRLRTTDEFGWMDEGQVAAVLLDAPASWAWMVAEDVLRDWPDGLARPACEVFSYPDNQARRTRGGTLRRRSTDASRHSARHASSMKPVARPVVHRMEPLFVQRMPTWKRSLDILGATVGLALALPLLILSVIAVRLTSPGPAIYRQKRAGLGGVPFTIYKLRTMRLDADAMKHELMAQNEQDGPAFKITHDPRVTPVGRVLRTTSLDELPQLFNVLRGNMSLVGPRPLPWEEAVACEGWQQRRLDVTPGLTGIWQVTGRARTGFADWVRMDMRYIRARSLFQDVKLLVLTIPAVILRKGAH